MRLARRSTKPGAAAELMLRLMTYNLLAPLFVRVPQQPYSDFPHASEAAIDWPARRARIIERLTGADADVVCLQEVQYDRIEPTPNEPTWVPPDWLERFAHARGYRIQPAPLDPKGWRRQAKRNLRAAGRLGCTGLVTLLREARTLDLTVIPSSRSLIVRFTLEGHRLTVANMHLEGHPDRGADRVKQLTSTLGRARAGEASHVVLAGDWNSTLSADDADRRPDPLVAAFVDEQKEMARIDVGPTWVGAPGRPAAVDHVLYDTTLRLVAAGADLGDADLGDGMPNDDSPSDHAPVWAELAPIAPPRAPPAESPPAATLPPDEVERLEAAWASLLDQAPATPRGKPSAEELVALQAFKAEKKAFLDALPSEAHRQHLRKKV